MEEKNELNDIILNKGNSSSSNKKVVLAVATLGVVLIIVVMLMNTLNSTDGENLPKPVPLPTPQSVAEKSVVEETPKEEALFEEVEVVQEKAIEENNLDQIAQKLKQESMAESTKEIKKTQSKSENSEASKKPVTQQKQQFTKTTQTKSSGEQYFVQVGSFSKYKPNKKFLDSITSKGYTYQFHKVGKLNKVLVGPFANEREARTALRTIRSNIEAGAFLTKK
ncbi:SPOR domain-containing protein [Sulfurimonas lithotrophica]|uniref:SPOR domain-containing protein n=1 Tax=Sulfurimonas lithotrophica TaxID=2590022 RepID=A0A5P8P189_9BACT|nr:SPOR domain-containing protein [Sulfurimonas lithotrophica]QFR49493.1 SPOR domain-containing protein [Sulfurimonas lithotrophica]